MVHVTHTLTTPPRLDDIAYQASPDFGDLCRDFDLDPGLALDAQLMSLADSRAFWLAYDARKLEVTGINGPEVASMVAALVRASEPDHPETPASLRVTAVTGQTITVQAADGSRWDLPVAPSTD